MTDQAMSPLRRRMIEDMTMRKFAPKTVLHLVDMLAHLRERGLRVRQRQQVVEIGRLVR